MLGHFEALHKVESSSEPDRHPEIGWHELVRVDQNRLGRNILSVATDHVLDSHPVPDLEPRTRSAAEIDNALDVKQ